MEGRPGETMEPLDFEALKRELSVQFPNINDQDVMSVAMYPHVAKEFLKYRGELVHGDGWCLGNNLSLYRMRCICLLVVKRIHLELTYTGSWDFQVSSHQ